MTGLRTESGAAMVARRVMRRLLVGALAVAVLSTVAVGGIVHSDQGRGATRVLASGPMAPVIGQGYQFPKSLTPQCRELIQTTSRTVPPDRSGGMVSIAPTTFLLMVLPTTPPALIRTIAARARAAGCSLVTRPATMSYAGLLDLVRPLELHSLASKDQAITGFSVDVPDNRLVVSLITLKTSYRRDLHDRLGDLVEVDQEPRPF